MADTTPSTESESKKGYNNQPAFVFYLNFYPAQYIADLAMNRSTLSGHVEEKQTTSKFLPDPLDAIASIDVHLLSVNEVYTQYSSYLTISLELAIVHCRECDGKNTISPPPTVYWKKLLNYILISYQPLGPPTAFILGVAILLLLIIIVFATFYALVDLNASRIMKSIKSLIAHEAVVVRDGNQQIIPAADIVVGDIAVLNAGDHVPADMCIVQAFEMVPGALDATSNNTLETRNLILTSTFVVQGTCHGVVFATGDRTIMGCLIKMLGEMKFKLTTIQKKVWFFTKIISCLALFFFLLLLLLYGVWLRMSYPGYDTMSSAIVNSIGCLTTFVLQGLPICVALLLTVVTCHMAKCQVLVKNLVTIKTLGCMSVLCSDKTGTLTAGKMMVENIAFLDDIFSIEEKTIRLLCNGAKFNVTTNHLLVQEHMIKGDPTNTTLLRFSEALSIPELDVDSSTLQKEYEKKFKIPFNSCNKWMLSVVSKVYNSEKNGDSTWMFVKGAPDVLFPSCGSVLQSDGTVVSLTGLVKQKITTLQENWSSQHQEKPPETNHVKSH
ncbi:E1-E2 ATPase-domain-containing protein [Suillus bovinus]|uniref:E1-E2 ATPase-domain-containing protein n=1 Tax=Suillus bovinus TaxID=48563 RepID=UPI001B86E7A8|nr:E1-E2 ATPase-domain-containing protein [Suillus bovinus]KAG2133792.1 E1-E2 ATPase-domain-containing protein [Suillus bovinus]